MLESVLAVLLTFATIIGGIAAFDHLLNSWRKRKQWAEAEKEVNSAWWESSELKKQYVAKGYQNFSWSNPDQVEKRISDGKEIVQECDAESRVSYKIVNRSGQVLMCHK